MNKIILLSLLLLVGCNQGPNTQDLNLAIYECKKVGSRIVALQNSEGKIYIQCRGYTKRKK